MKTFTPIIKEEQGELVKVPETTDREKSKKAKIKKPMTLEQQIIQQRCILKAVKAKLQGLMNQQLVQQIQYMKIEQKKKENLTK